MSRVVWARVLGRGSLVWSTGEPSAYPDGADSHDPVLVAVPGALSSRMEPLDTIAADSAIDLQLAVTADTRALLYAARVTQDPPERLTRGVAPGDVRIYTTAQGVTVGEAIWVDRECMRVDVIEADGYTVTRGLYGSTPVSHGIGPVGSAARPRVGTRIYTRAPDIVGQWVELGYSEGDEAVTVWRGVVESLGTADRTTITIRCASLMSALRSRTIAEPGVVRWDDGKTPDVNLAFSGDPIYAAPSVSDGERVATSRIDNPPTVWFDADEHPGMPEGDGYVRLLSPETGDYVVLRAEYADTVTQTRYGDAVYRLRGYSLPVEVTVGDVVQAGGSGGPHELDTADRRREALRVLATPVTDLAITWVVATSASAVDAIASLLTTREFPLYGAGLPDEWIGTSDAGTLALLLDIVWTSLRSYSDAILWVPAPPSGRLLDYADRVLLRPLGAGLSHDDGAVRVVDWGRDVTDAIDVVDDETSREPRRYEWVRDAYQGASVAQLARAPESLVIATDRGGGSLIGTAAREIDCSAALALDALGPRWSALTYRYGVALPTVTLSARTGDLRVGSVVTLTRSDLPLRADGTPCDDEGVVVARARNVRSDVDTLTIVVTTWIEDVPGLRWGPAATIASVTSIGGGGYEVGIEAGAWSADDPAVWALVDLPEAVDILDATGAVVESGATLTAVAADVLTIFAASAPTVGQWVVLTTGGGMGGAANLARWSWLTPSAIAPDYRWGP